MGECYYGLRYNSGQELQGADETGVSETDREQTHTESGHSAQREGEVWGSDVTSLPALKMVSK